MSDWLAGILDDTKVEADEAYQRYALKEKKRMATVKKVGNIGFIGLGKLGLPVALAIENRGYKVIGYDIDPKIKDYLNSRVIPYQEEGVSELLRHTNISLKTIYDVVQDSEIVFIAVQTPHDPGYEGITKLPKDRVDFDYSYLKKAVKDVAMAANDLQKKIILVVISTVLPGTTDREIKPFLNKYTKFVYNPFLIAMGTTRSDFEKPEMIILGGDNKKALDHLEEFYKTINNSPVFRTSVAHAEAVKVLYNTFISTKIAFANTIGMLSHKMDLNADEIMRGLFMGKQRIISTKYLLAGMGDGGGCHPRDGIALSWLSKKLELPFDWFENIMIQREKHIEWLADLVEEHARKKDTNQVVLCGVAYKKNINLTIGSSALLLKDMLTDRGFKVYEWDPYVYPDQKRSSLRSLNKRLFFIGTDHDEFKDLKFNPNSIVIDVWGIIKPQEGCQVICVGRKQ